MRKWRELTTKEKVMRYFKISAVVLLVAIVVSAFAEPQENQQAVKDSPPAPKVNQQPQQTPPEQKKEKELSYETVKTWNIPNGGQGKTIVVSRSYFNENDLRRLGEKLRDETKDQRNAFISVFTDRKAAEMRDRVLSDELTTEEQKFYEQHYVAQYTQNANSKLKEYTIYFDGPSGSNQKTVNF